MKKRWKRWHAIVNRLPIGPVVGVEVGVWEGNNAWELLRRKKDLHLILVDRWKEYPPEEILPYATGLPRLPQARFELAYVRARQVADKYRTRVQILRTESVEAAEMTADESLDFVFLDGRHDAEGLAMDIQAWWPKLKPGGLLGGHDYRQPTIPDVTTVVDGVFQDVDDDDDHTWFVRVRAEAPPAGLKKFLPKRSRPKVEEPDEVRED